MARGHPRAWLHWPKVAGLLSSLVLVGCAGPAVPDPPRVLPARVLDAYDLERGIDLDEAARAQRAVRLTRDEVSDGLARERIACYRRFLLNRCLREVAERQRIIEARIDAVEVAANQRLRDEAARVTSQRLAEDAARRAQQAAGASEREAVNRQAFEARQAAAAAAAARRQQDAPELERRAERLRADAERREREVQARRLEAERKREAQTQRRQSVPDAPVRVPAQ